jgi:hypothetical protein
LTWAAGACTAAAVVALWNKYDAADEERRRLQRELVALREDVDEVRARPPVAVYPRPPDPRTSEPVASMRPSGPPLTAPSTHTPDGNRTTAPTGVNTQRLDEEVDRSFHDRAAASDVERQFSSYVQDAKGSRVEEVSCGEMFCRIRVVHDGQEAQSTLAHHFAEAPPFPEETAYRYDSESGSHATLLYVAREGKSLREFMGR